jgi:anaerobic selenocysteine-containing dehydrogenase
MGPGAQPQRRRRDDGDSCAAGGGRESFGVRGGGYTMSNSGAYGIQAETLINVPAPPVRVVNMNLLGRTLLEATPPVAVLFVYNCNPLATVPDQNRVRQGLMREDLFTVVHEQLMTDSAKFADLILPATTFLEQYDVARGYGSYSLQLVQPVIAPVGEARSNHDVFMALSDRLGLESYDEELGEAGALMDLTSGCPPPHASAILERTAADVPGGGHPIQFVDVLPKTADGRAHLFPDDLPRARGCTPTSPTRHGPSIRSR